MENTYKKILEELKKISFSKSAWDEENFYQEVVKERFISKMNYESRDSCYKECRNTFQKKDLLIKGSVQDKWEKELAAFPKQVEKEGCIWGILMHPAGIWLINLETKPRTNSNFRNSQVVLEIVHGLNTDQKYFKYFSEENVIGLKKNACFFRDIIEYKNNGYKGTEKSWPAYESALKRFLEYYIEDKGDYSNEDNIYDSIQYAFFVEFVKNKTKCHSLKSARNAFFYIKDFMQIKSERKEFDDPGQVSKSFQEFVPKYEMQDVMCVDKLAIALKYLSKNRNGTRNKAILLFLLAFGMERRKLCGLTWDNILFHDGQLDINKKKYPMPTYLLEVLTKLRDQDAARGYIFRNSGGEVLSDGAINIVLSGIAKADRKDVFYTQLSPVNVRRCVAKYLLEHEYPLQKILYLMDIEVYQLGSYLSKEEIDKTFWGTGKDKIICLDGQHPLEKLFGELKQLVEESREGKNDV